MKFLKLPKELFLKYWLKIDERDRRLIRLYLIISNSLLVACLMLIVALSPEEPLPLDSDKEANQAKNATPSSPSASPINQNEMIDEPLDSTNLNESMDSNQLNDNELNTGLAGGLENTNPPNKGTLKPIDTKAHEIVVDYQLRDLKYKEALPHLQRLYEEKKDPDLLYQIGETFLNAGQPDSALGRLERVHRLFPTSEKSKLPLIQALFQSGKAKEALQKMEMLSNEDPSAQNLSLLGGMQSEAYPRHNDADELFKKAYQTDSNSIDLYREKGLFEYRRGNFATALLDAEKFRQRDPLNFRAYAQKGAALFQLNRIDQAEQEFRAALGLAPEDYTSWYNLGEVYYRRSYLANSSDEVRAQNIKSLEYYIESLKHQPDHPRAHFRVGVLLLNNRQYKEAILHFEKTIASEPNHYLAHLQSGIAYQALGLKQKAKESYSEAYRIEPLNRVISQKFKEFQNFNE